VLSSEAYGFILIMTLWNAEPADMTLLIACKRMYDAAQLFSVVSIVVELCPVTYSSMVMLGALYDLAQSDIGPTFLCCI
jgi:hypothetical protein